MEGPEAEALLITCEWGQFQAPNVPRCMPVLLIIDRPKAISERGIYAASSCDWAPRSDSFWTSIPGGRLKPAKARAPADTCNLRMHAMFPPLKISI